MVRSNNEEQSHAGTVVCSLKLDQVHSQMKKHWSNVQDRMVMCTVAQKITLTMLGLGL